MISQKWFGLLLTSCLLSCILASAVNKNLVNVRIRRNLVDEDEKFRHSSDNSDDYINDVEPEDADDDEDWNDGNEDEEPNVVNNGEPIEITSKPVNYTLQARNSVWLPCNINHLEGASVKWLKDSDNIYVNSYKISKNNRIHRYDNNTISIVDFMEEDVGVYTCELASGNRAKISYHVNLMSKPSIYSILPERKEDRILIENSPLTIECKANGYPKPKITWSRKGHRITDDDVQFIDQSIFIKHVHRKDSGMYQCLADNGVGNPAHGSIDIKILYAPEVHIKKSVVNTDEGYKAELFCIVHSDPRSIIKWFKDEKEIENSPKYQLIVDKNGTHLSLKIRDVQPEDFGLYYCNASNQLGTNSGHIKLVKQPGRALWNTGSQEGDSNPILEWTVESIQKLTDVELKYSKIDEINPNPEIKEQDWIVVRPNIDDPVGNKYIIRHVIKELRPGKYVAQLRAKNDHGWSELSDQHTFDGDYESNEIRAEERLDEGKVAEIATGIASVSYSTISTLLVSLVLLYIAKIY